MVRGTVASVKPYGIFVRMEGFRANALVHLSQVQKPRCPMERLLFCRTVLVAVMPALCASTYWPCWTREAHVCEHR